MSGKVFLCDRSPKVFLRDRSQRNRFNMAGFLIKPPPLKFKIEIWNPAELEGFLIKTPRVLIRNLGDSM